MVISCCVPGCKSKGNSVVDMKIKLFRFPKDAIRRQLWVKAISREGFVPTYHRVCNAHFTKDDYQKRPDLIKLTNKAIPTVFNNHSVNKVNIMQQSVQKKKVSLSPVKKPYIPPIKNHNSWDHTYVQQLPEASTFEETSSDNIPIDPSLYMIQTLSVNESTFDEPTSSEMKDIEPCITEFINKQTTQSLQNTQKDWMQISLAQSYTIKDLRKKVKILQQKVRRYATKIEALKVGDSSRSEALPRKRKVGIVIET